ncbi:alpha/beta fold hydrolase [Altericroceibacterium endophyticum]|uniref:Alpha/beta fold hydrolase n=1 Tax=Altericroceibacterium endophyticum TaxID=1808508 RepID=A0A6I4T5M3_9SPHN|nr:alpha/beta hydrolase [Altericroceibacterium endophyticum]MXO66504.1 alpha/beta fold hydrolase [Altericroceibacterium endophyticum]
MAAPLSSDRASFDPREIPQDVSETRWQAPDGHSIRLIEWPQQVGQKGTLLFLPGRGDAYEKYLEACDHWARNGWHVVSTDWRGQGASGRFGKDAYTGHIADFAIWLDDLAALWQAKVAGQPGAHILLGHSMGGHLAMRAVGEGRVAPDGLILSAPMAGLLPEKVPLPILHAIAKFMSRIGDDRRPAWKWSEKPGAFPEARSMLLTHDHERYRDEQWWREARPEIVMGPGSWRWVERALASIRVLEQPGFLEKITIPVFLFGTRADRLVSFRALERAAQRLPNCETLFFGEEARHEILREVDPVRHLALERIDNFLDRITQP